MATLRMNPLTGQPEFREQTPVVNEVTGQQANTAGQPAVATAQPLPQPVQEPFAVDVQDRGVDVANLNDTNTTSSVFGFLEQAEQSSQSRITESLRQQQELQAQILELSQPSPELEDALAALNTVREDRERLLDFSEDRQVDIGTIRGEQAQTQREFARREQTAINRANLLLNRQAQQISATEKALAFNQQNLDTVLKLSELTSPEIIGQEIDPVTGEVIAFTQNADGTISSQIIGQISVPDPSKETVGIVTNKATGQQSLVSLKDGVMVVEPIEGTAGVAGPKPLTEADRLRNELLRAQIERTRAETGQVGVETAQEEKQARDKVNDVLSSVNKLITDQGAIDALSGKSALVSFVPGTKGFDAKTDFDRLVGLLTVDNLSLMSGVLSDSDIKILQSAGTSLRPGMSRDAFVGELTRLQNTLSEKADQLGTPLEAQATNFGFSPEDQEEIDFLLLSPASTPTTSYSPYF